MDDLDEVLLTVDCFEAMRLSDLEGLTTSEAALRMDVSRHTFGRILAEGRQCVARALVRGLALRIEGGPYVVHDETNRTRGEYKEIDMTKVAVTSEGPTLTDLVDPRFGRAAGFAVVDVDTMEVTYVDNGDSQARAQGAGIQAAEKVSSTGASTVLTGFVGPKAFQALSAAGIKVAQDLGGLTVEEAVKRFKAGDVTMADSPNR